MSAEASESSEKRFDATPLRRDRAQREGNAARSHEVAGIAAFAGALLGLGFVLPPLTGAAVVAVRDGALHGSPDTAPAALVLALGFVPAAGAGIAATAASLAQTRGLRIVAPRLAFDKLAPWPGLRRMAGADAAVGGARALAAFAVVLAAVVAIGVRTVVAASGSTSLQVAADAARGGMLEACWTAAGIGALFAAVDYAVVRGRWLRSLKMTFDEFKRDAKEQDGDPHAKSRRKHLHRALVSGAISRTREASFVVVNPTHVALAIRYAPPAVPVPRIVVRAADAAALEVRAIAERAHIPVVEDVPLARLLWLTGEAGRSIPPEAFVAVAYVIAALVRTGVLVP